MDVESDIEALLSAAHTLRLRLAGRSRSETFTPGSIAPELLRRAEELLSELPAALAKLQAERDEAREALRVADSVIEAMVPYVGKMALGADELSAMNQHWLFMDRFRAASRAMGDGE